LSGDEPEDLEERAVREKAKELLAETEPAPTMAPPVFYTPRMPDEDDLEPVFAELLEERYAFN
jgi:hypothetical protein